MSFSINTNVTSLQAQNYLTQSSNFQQQTINEVTSGLRIVNSGDDAAGLAVANGMASDLAVLTQGIQNANNGLASLHTIDGGMSNINTLLDRAQTLAAESASGTFTGNRSTLDSEFQSVLTEINRQAQSIGLNTGGSLAQSLNVYIGGGEGTTAAAANANGQININLSGSAVDAQALGLNGYTAGYQVASGSADTGLYDLSNGSSTSVSAILGVSGNTSTETTAGYTQFTIQGAGFSDSNKITLNVNTAGVVDTSTLTAAINSAISAAGAGGTAAANAFKAANVQATIHTGADGHQQLLFTSSNTAFTVQAGDKVANAFLGNLGTNTGGSATNATSAGEAIAASAYFNAGGTYQVSDTYAAGASAQNINFTTVDSSGASHTATVTVSASNIASAASTAASINSQLQATGISSLEGITAVVNQAGTGITFESNSNFTVNAGTTTDTDGLQHGSQDAIQTAAVTGTGSSVNILSTSNAQAAITALTNAVQVFGTAQAAVGRGENNLNYAISLAQSKSTNEAAAESGIKDADLAAEAANLTKAQILMQAGTAALAQANSAPQALLSLLQH